jgi:hypothetical protein
VSFFQELGRHPVRLFGEISSHQIFYNIIIPLLRIAMMGLFLLSRMKLVVDR